MISNFWKAEIGAFLAFLLSWIIIDLVYHALNPFFPNLNVISSIEMITKLNGWFFVFHLLLPILSGVLTGMFIYNDLEVRKTRRKAEGKGEVKR